MQHGENTHKQGKKKKKKNSDLATAHSGQARYPVFAEPRAAAFVVRSLIAWLNHRAHSMVDSYNQWVGTTQDKLW
jgi:hypothetical protein